MKNCVEAGLIFASSPLIWDTLCDRGAVASGERRLPACRFRQMAEIRQGIILQVPHAKTNEVSAAQFLRPNAWHLRGRHILKSGDLSRGERRSACAVYAGNTIESVTSRSTVCVRTFS